MRALFRSSGGGGAAGLLNGIGGLVAGIVGSPGRSTGGPVSAGRSYMVGERGPELFVPSTTGRVEPVSRATRDVRVSIALHTPAPGDPQVLRQSSRQVARAIRSAVRAER